MQTVELFLKTSTTHSMKISDSSLTEICYKWVVISFNEKEIPIEKIDLLTPPQLQIQFG